jgi:hypothetical protein
VCVCSAVQGRKGDSSDERPQGFGSRGAGVSAFSKILLDFFYDFFLRFLFRFCHVSRAVLNYMLYFIQHIFYLFIVGLNACYAVIFFLT